jgi:hypothetical protein
MSRRAAAGLAGVALAVACGEPAPPPAAEVAAIPVERALSLEALTPEARAMRDRLLAIAEAGDYRDMAALAALRPDFRSNAGGVPHRDYWYLKYRTGDWPMAHLGRALAFPPAIVETEAGRVFVWPYMAALESHELTVAAERDVVSAAGGEAARAMRRGAPYPGYSLAISAAGEWLYFISGAEVS